MFLRKRETIFARSGTDKHRVALGNQFDQHQQNVNSEQSYFVIFWQNNNLQENFERQKWRMN